MNPKRIASWRPPSVRLTTAQVVASFVARRRWFIPAVVGPVAGFVVLSFELGLFANLLARADVTLTLLAVLFVVAAVVAACRFANRLVEEHAYQIPHADFADALPRLRVLIDFEFQGHLYGHDRGDLTIVDDWLIFEGDRTSFSLSPADVAVGKVNAAGRKRDRMVLLMRSAGVGVSLALTSDEIERDPYGFLVSWIGELNPPVGMSVLPPFEKMPGIKKLSLNISNIARLGVLGLFGLVWLAVFLMTSPSAGLVFGLATLGIFLLLTGDAYAARNMAFKKLKAASQDFAPVGLDRPEGLAASMSAGVGVKQQERVR